MRKWYAAIVLLAIYTPAIAASDPQFFGLLRARDLTPFGFLRLDMRPSYAGSSSPGSWAVETDLAYQNTWALSPEVERYLDSLPGRRNLGPNELQAIRDLPGENYLVDLELAQLDVTLHYQLSANWGAYLILSGASYDGGFLDGTIEGFHRTFGFSTFGRPAVSRNQINLLFDLKSTQYVSFDAPSSGGLLDPTIGVRYTGMSISKRWKLVLGSAVKVAIGDRRSLLSTGRTDFGLQASLQRFWESQALYVDLSAVYYAGATGVVPSPAQILPTLVVGYERRLTSRTNAILQGYVSPSVYTRNETDLDVLRATKFQVSAGVRHHRGRNLISFALTENLQNVDDTPDIGFQLGWSFVPGRHSSSGCRSHQSALTALVTSDCSLLMQGVATLHC
jgi:hypothetical protein